MIRRDLYVFRLFDGQRDLDETPLVVLVAVVGGRESAQHRQEGQIAVVDPHHLHQQQQDQMHGYKIGSNLNRLDNHTDLQLVAAQTARVQPIVEGNVVARSSRPQRALEHDGRR